MRRLTRIIGVAILVAAFVAGCGEQHLDDSGSTVVAYDRYGYVVDATGSRTDGPRYLGRTEAEVPDTDSPEEELMIAVTVLLDGGDHLSRGDITYWEGVCAPGRGPKSVEVHPGTVVLRLAGVVPEHRTCTMTAAERDVQEQQIAWTIRENLDPFAEEKPPLVRVIEADGHTWEAVADPSFIPPIYRPTN